MGLAPSLVIHWSPLYRPHPTFLGPARAVRGDNPPHDGCPFSQACWFAPFCLFVHVRVGVVANLVSV